MRHGMANRKLGRTSSHRAAMFRNQIASMISNERIITTLPKAKELRPIVEKMVTLGKNDSVHTRRVAARSIVDGGLVQKLFTDISPRFASRPGGYTRIIKLGPRRGDGAEMAILEFVDYQFDAGKETAGQKKARKAAAKKEAAQKAEAPEAPEPEKEEAAEAKPARKPAAKKAAKKAAPKKEAAPKKPAAKKAAAKGESTEKPAGKRKKKEE